jgi:tetratricopeptide (TPR) repeat protein
MAPIVGRVRRIFGRKQDKAERASNAARELQAEQIAKVNASVDRLRQVQLSAPDTGTAASIDPFLAELLVEQSRMLLGFDRLADALPCAVESVGIYRRLAASGQATAEASLANALHLVSAIQAKLGRYEEALVAADGSIEIFRRLTAAGSVSIKPDALAGILVLRGQILADLGRFEDALTANDEGLAAWRELAGADPGAGGHLAATLGMRHSILVALGRLDEAQAADEEAKAVLLMLRRRAEAAVKEALDSLT